MHMARVRLVRKVSPSLNNRYAVDVATCSALIIDDDMVVPPRVCHVCEL